MPIKKQSKIALIKPNTTKIKLGSTFIKDYSPTEANFFAVYDMLKERNIEFTIIGNIKKNDKILRSQDIIFLFENDKTLTAKLISLTKKGKTLFCFGESIENKEISELLDLEVASSKRIITPKTSKLYISSNLVSCPEECLLNVNDSLNNFSLISKDKNNILASTANTAFIVKKSISKGELIYIYDLGFSLFNRYAECTHINKEKNIANKGFDDIEPLIWTLFKRTLIEKGNSLVYSSISPKIKSFSVAHDTEDTDCLESGSRIIKLDNQYKISATWYLRIITNLPQYDGRPFLYAKPFILNPTNYTPKKASLYLKNQIFGLHSEQYSWIKKNLKPSLDLNSIYSHCANSIRALKQKVRSGSMHFGNYAEKYPEDYLALESAGLLLWRNSYKFNGITPFRPYILFHNSIPLKIRGFNDNLIDDFIAFDLNKNKYQINLAKNLFWINVLGEGNIFLHSHPHNFDDVKGGISNYNNLYKVLSKDFINTNNEEIIDYLSEKETQSISFEENKREIKIFLSDKPSNLILNVESNSNKKISVFHNKSKLNPIIKEENKRKIISFKPLQTPFSSERIDLSYSPIKGRKTRVKLRHLAYKIKQIPGKIIQILNLN